MEFIKKIKNLGYFVKLDTNGTNPELIQFLVSHHLVDKIAMDIKTSQERYPVLCGIKKPAMESIEKSVSFLLKNSVDYEFRTTVSKPLHSTEDLRKIGEQIKGAKRYFIQNYQYQDSVLDKSLKPLTKEELYEAIEVVKTNVENVCLRGIE